MGGWKQKEERGSKSLPFSFVPCTFLFLSQLSVCLCVSRVRAYLSEFYVLPILTNFKLTVLW
jgi:hypothetical protein